MLFRSNTDFDSSYRFRVKQGEYRKKGWTDQAEESRKRWIKTFMYVTEITKWSLSEIRALHYMEFFLLLDECTDRTKREAAAMKKK